MSNQNITSALLEEEPNLIDLIDKFISRLPGMCDEIVKVYEQQDWDIFLKLIHQMKGVGGNYGYPMLSELCVAIEIACKDEDFSKVKNQLDEFNAISERILAGSDENHKIAKENE